MGRAQDYADSDSLSSSLRQVIIMNLSLKAKSLHTMDLCSTINHRMGHKPSALSIRVRQRLRDEADARAVSQRELAERLTELTGDVWSQSKVGKILTGQVEFRLDDMAALSDALGIAPSEAVRDRGVEFYAEMTPTELRVLEELRRRPGHVQAMMVLLDVPLPSLREVPGGKRRKAGPLKAKP